MQAQSFSEVLNDLGFVFVGVVGRKNVYTISNDGKLQLTDELGFLWEIPEHRLHDDQKCQMCGRREYVSHMFAVQTLH